MQKESWLFQNFHEFLVSFFSKIALNVTIAELSVLFPNLSFAIDHDY